MGCHRMGRRGALFKWRNRFAFRPRGLRPKRAYELGVAQPPVRRRRADARRAIRQFDANRTADPIPDQSKGPASCLLAGWRNRLRRSALRGLHRSWFARLIPDQARRLLSGNWGGNRGGNRGTSPIILMTWHCRAALSPEYVVTGIPTGGQAFQQLITRKTMMKGNAAEDRCKGSNP